MGKDRLVTIAEIQAPNFNVFVGTGSRDERRIGGNVDGQSGQLVSVEREEEFESVDEKNFDRRIEKRDRDKATVPAHLENIFEELRWGSEYRTTEFTVIWLVCLVMWLVLKVVEIILFTRIIIIIVSSLWLMIHHKKGTVKADTYLTEL